MIQVISIDGACRRNGKPDCTSAGGAFITFRDDYKIVSCCTLTSSEHGSTNQRGELLALLETLRFILNTKEDTQIITDSEYIYNAMTKEWFVGWERRGWLTANLEPVKNQDLWQQIKQAYERCQEAGMDIVFYHIKGHCISIGKVTALNLLRMDPTGRKLFDTVSAKYDQDRIARTKNLIAASELSRTNNGFPLSGELLKHFVVMNVMADVVATDAVEIADTQS